MTTSCAHTARGKSRIVRFAWALACFALAILLVAALIPARAFGYYNFGLVGVSPGVSSISVEVGGTASTSITVTPASDDQTLGCGMAKCPQVCTSEGAIEAGYNCFDVNGQCTCAGPAYSTYYPEVTASSSNSGVATATVSGSTLSVQGNATGRATITVTASLRQWETNTTTVEVEVTAAQSTNTDTGGNTGGSTGGNTGGNGSGGTTDSGGNAGATNTGSTNSGGTANSGGANTGGAANAGGNTASANNAANTAVETPEAAQPSDSSSNQLNETVVQTVAGTVYTVEANGSLSMKDEIAKLTGEHDQLVVWSGTSSSRPDWSWTFTGDAVDAQSPYADFDPTITVSDLGTGDVANIVGQANDHLVLDFAHEGDLPGTATIYVHVDGTYDDGTTLKIYCYDESQKRFVLGAEGITVTDGYAAFRINHCSTWALSTDDLSNYTVSEVNTPRAIAADKNAIGTEGANEGLSPAIVILLAAAVVVVIAVVAALVLRRRKASAAPGETTSDAATTPEAAVPEAATTEAAAPDAATTEAAAPEAAAPEAAATETAPASEDSCFTAGPKPLESASNDAETKGEGHDAEL